MSVTCIGIDLGSSKTILIADDGDLVRTCTGSVSRPSVVCFNGRSRYIDEDASSQSSADSIIKSFNLYLDQNTHNSMAAPTAICDQNGRVMFPIQYNNCSTDMSVASLLGMFLAKQDNRVNEVYPSQEKVRLAFVLPPNSSAAATCTIKQACCVAGIELDRICTINKIDALMVAYARKVHALQPDERLALEGKKVVLLEMGNTQTTAVLISTNSLSNKKFTALANDGPAVVRNCYNENLGAAHFDEVLFAYFADICEKKHQTSVSLHSKRGRRLINGCERIRKLLSQLPQASVTIENLTDNGDVTFSLSRDELQKLCSSLLNNFKEMITADLLKDMSPREVAEIGGVEILGGGIRMTIVQSLICEIFRDCKSVNNVTGPGTTSESPITAQKSLGAKLDDGSIALGAALIAKSQLDGEINTTQSESGVFCPIRSLSNSDTGVPEDIIGFSSQEVESMVEIEKDMLKQDNEIEQLLAARNDLEAFLLDCRSFKRHKYGTSNYMDLEALDRVVDEYENWMYDEPEASLEIVKEKFNSLHEVVHTDICRKYFDAVEADRKQAEAQLADEAAKAAAEKAASPDEEQDFDTRKLKKADRMRLVLKNKEEATEIFKGGVYKTACARYSKALTHCTKFFDLSPEDESEVKQIKITLYLNIAMCYLKMDKPDQVLNNCNHALELDARNAKAFFRRSAAWEAKKDLQKALEDAKKAQLEVPVPDKAINSAVARLKKAIAEEKNQQKKMWGNAFA